MLPPRCSVPRWELSALSSALQIVLQTLRSPSANFTVKEPCMSGCFAGIVHVLASARCCKAEERRGLCVCVYLYVYWYLQLCVWWAVDAAGVSPGPEGAAEFPRPVLGRCRRGFFKLWPELMRRASQMVGLWAVSKINIFSPLLFLFKH